MSELPKTLASRLADEFADRDYAHAYMEEHAVSRIAAQVLTLRQQRGWSQSELARRAHVAQERVSKIENADFDSLTMKTLHKLAHAFDVAVHIGFESFSTGILDVVNLSKDRLRVESREDSLAIFTTNRIIKHCGDWKSVNGDHLSPVETFKPSAPVNPTAGHTWMLLANNG